VLAQALAEGRVLVDREDRWPQLSGEARALQRRAHDAIGVYGLSLSRAHRRRNLCPPISSPRLASSAFQASSRPIADGFS